MANSAEKMIVESETLNLGIINEAGWPMIYPMEKVLSIGLEKVVFITKKNSNKVKNIQNCNKCCIEYYKEQEIVWLLGKIDIITDFTEIKKILPEKYWKRLTSHANFEDYCTLVFKSEEIKLYQEGIIKEIKKLL